MDAILGYELLNFIDALSRYNQIQIAPEDEKTTFIIDQGLFYYRVMPFGLKNIGATYQCFTNKFFKGQVRWNIEIYVDDMLIKNWVLWTYIEDLEEIFTTLQKYRMKLNPMKYAFRVTLDKFLRLWCQAKG